MTLVSKSKEKIAKLKEELKKHFKLRDLGGTSFLLGIKMERDRPNHTLKLSQHQYTLDILARFGFTSCSPVSTPLNPGIKLSLDQCPKTKTEIEEMHSVPYAHAVGSLITLLFPLGQTLPMQWEYLQGSVPTLAPLIGLLSSTSFAISKVHLTTS